MRIFTNKTVKDAALDRIRFLFDEFPSVVVSMSGGKDSTTVFELALQVAREKNRLPLPVMWLDQEAEWQGTADYVDEVMRRPEVKPYWYQVPMVMTNNASSFERYSHCWKSGDEEKWIRPQSPISIKENRFGVERFHEFFAAIAKVDFPSKTCFIAGVRTEESPKRAMSLTYARTYRWITWGKVLNKTREQFTFYPIYDWGWHDVWKFIHDNKVRYNRVYDEMYRHGVNVKDMRISNLHHETAIQNLMLVQEIEPQTWNRLAARIDGANTIKHIHKASFTAPKEVPSMFQSWEAYAKHLADTIIQEEKYRKMLYDRVNSLKKVYDGENVKDHFFRMVVNTILSSDWDFTKLNNWTLSSAGLSYKRFKQGKYLPGMLQDAKFFTTAELQLLMDKINATVKTTN